MSAVASGITTQPQNIVEVVDSFIGNFVASKIPAAANLQPEVDTAIAAGVALAEKALTVYALSKINAKNPALAAEIQKVAAAVGVAL